MLVVAQCLVLLATVKAPLPAMTLVMLFVAPYAVLLATAKMPLLVWLCVAANMAMVALMAAESGINPEAYRKWAMTQIHYALGDTGFSYVVGFGDHYPLMPHHRGA